MKRTARIKVWIASTMLAAATPAMAQDLHWYRGNTHAHTLNSDGDSSPDTVARWYREHGYDFLFITDHEYVTDAAALTSFVGGRDRFLVLPGQEVTQWGEDPKRSAAHVNGLFLREVIFPVGTRKCAGSGCGAHAPAEMPLAKTFAANIAAILAQGGIAQVNHPNYRWSVVPADLDGIPDGTLLEIWNGQGHINNLGGDDGAGDVRPSAEGYWDYLLSRGKIVWGAGSDDSHDFAAPGVNDPNGAAPGQAWIMVHAPALSPEAIKTALRAGDFYASTGVTLDNIGVDGTQFSITIKQEAAGNVRFAPRYRTRFIGQDGRLLAEAAGIGPSYRFVTGDTYVRAVVTDSNGRQAWTQPVFRDGRKAPR